MTRVLTLIVMAVVLLAGVPAATSAAAEPVRKYDQLSNDDGDLYPAQIGDETVTAEHAAAMGVGAVLGAMAAQVVLDGLLGTVAGVILGVLVGDWWYQEGLWPFDARTFPPRP